MKELPKINPNHPIADRAAGFCACVIVWYKDDAGNQLLDYAVGPFTTDRGALDWAERNRAKGRTCTIELLIAPLSEPAERPDA